LTFPRTIRSCLSGTIISVRRAESLFRPLLGFHKAKQRSSWWSTRIKCSKACLCRAVGSATEKHERSSSIGKDLVDIGNDVFGGSICRPIRKAATPILPAAAQRTGTDVIDAVGGQARGHVNS